MPAALEAGGRAGRSGDKPSRTQPAYCAGPTVVPKTARATGERRAAHQQLLMRAVRMRFAAAGRFLDGGAALLPEDPAVDVGLDDGMDLDLGVCEGGVGGTERALLRDDEGVRGAVERVVAEQQREARPARMSVRGRCSTSSRSAMKAR